LGAPGQHKKGEEGIKLRNFLLAVCEAGRRRNRRGEGGDVESKRGIEVRGKEDIPIFNPV